MFTTFLAFFLTIAAVNSEATSALSLRLLYQSNATLGEATSFGPGPYGTRVSIPIAGGTFSGERLSGKILNVGAEWGVFDDTGVFMADATYQLQTHDGGNIFVRASGPTQPNGNVLTRVLLETGDRGYLWLNNILVVGKSTVGKTWVAVEAYEVVDGGSQSALQS